jgi:hypothetical protein
VIRVRVLGPCVSQAACLARLAGCRRRRTQDVIDNQEIGRIVSENSEIGADIAVLFEVLYDTPTGCVRMKVKGYTNDAAARGVKCQVSRRRAGGAEERCAPMGLDEVLQTEATAAVLDGDALYLRIIDTDGRDLAVSKIDETKWPREATPRTVETKSYWLTVPLRNLAS